MNQAKEYAETNAIQFRHVAELVDEFPKEFKKMKGRIIDIGCGPGNITRDVLLPNVDKDAVIVGADVCANMIEYAKQHYGVDDKLSYLQLDIQTPELPENLIEHFDNAVSFYALHWCKNTKQVLKNIYKLLRPGGKAIILTISHHMIYDMYPEQENDPRFAPYVKNSMKWAPPHQGCSDAEQIMKKDLIEAKFNVEYCTNKWETFKYPSFEAFMGKVHMQN
ncbi:lovastatin nonaketide synthase-like [Fopius arisanus]|uniref:Lovastatin nonaketide synthase-like n=1 Tax=Fopius arisanus TaxID=64838 RepID=A0A9R1U6Y2_9HYME|nr:PREDICTED: lovastatin nonaketide synthase-like [Fopius arisanus]